jgi:hypothetical protein
MNLFSRSICFFLLLSVLIGCSNSSDYRSLELVSKRLIEIPIDAETSTSWLFTQIYKQDGEEYLVYQDLLRTDPKSIHFAHLGDISMSFEVPLSIEGPDGIGHLDGFYVRNLDSIFVLNRYAYELNLVNSSGKVIDTYRLRKDESNLVTSEPTTLPYIQNFAPVINLGKTLIIPSVPDQVPFESDYKGNLLTIELDLKSKEIKYNLGFSDKNIESGFWGLHLEDPSYTVNYKDSIILPSFPIDDRVMVYDFDLRLVKSPSVFKNYYSNKFHSLPEFTMEPSIFYPHIYSNPRNNAILYDKYRDLYYRVMTGPHPQETIESMDNSSWSQGIGNYEKPSRKIVVFDRNFEEIGVLELDKNRYWIDFIRVVKEGIIISLQTENEDKKVFEIFEIKI